MVSLIPLTGQFFLAFIIIIGVKNNKVIITQTFFIVKYYLRNFNGSYLKRTSHDYNSNLPISYASLADLKKSVLKPLGYFL